jgi:hypothetical protein
MTLKLPSVGRPRIFWLLFLFASITLLLALAVSTTPKPAPVSAASSTSQLYMPVVAEGSPALLCRFGVNAIRPIEPLNLPGLRIGWYLYYSASSTAPTPKGMAYTPVIRLSQVGANGYSYTPSGAQLQAVIAAYPGADWLIGNEPDRRGYQDDLEPHVYAAVYHELYGIIKTADPTARIFAGAIVQPTPVRLQYLDMVLESYQQTHGVPMPVDGWSIHNFILNEVSCDYDPTNCWGADIPPGIDVPFGEVLTVEDNDRVDLFIERIGRFRQWMQDRGYGGLPISLSEYGVLMPDWLGFTPERVNIFMNATFDYLLTATDPVLGDPHDGYRLVQKWSWYSTGAPGDPYNGNLYQPDSSVLTPMGANFAAYTAQIGAEVDVYPVTLSADPPGPGGAITLRATIANSGNLATAVAAPVRFYDGNPAAGGTLIGDAPAVALPGCGHNKTAEIVWPDPAPGSHQIYVVVDPDGLIGETNEQNNSISQTIVVGN